MKQERFDFSPRLEAPRLAVDALGQSWEVVAVCSREQALADGVLVDVTPWAKETGFRVPVAVTRALWDGYVEPAKMAPGNDVRGRAHDLLWMFYLAARRNANQGRVPFQVIFTMKAKNGRWVQRTVDVAGQLGPGDDGEPVMTLMLPKED